MYTGKLLYHSWHLGKMYYMARNNQLCSRFELSGSHPNTISTLSHLYSHPPSICHLYPYTYP